MRTIPLLPILALSVALFARVAQAAEPEPAVSKAIAESGIAGGLLAWGRGR